MKKITILALALGTCSIAQAQVLSHGLISNDLLKTNYFLDASNFQSQADASKGKLLGFPKTDLTQFKFDLKVVTDEVTLSGFDGVVVYNTATGKTLADASKGGKQVDVTPGFYYFSNPNGATNQTVSEGKWVRLSDSVNQEGQEWVYDATTNRINLKRSGGGLFGNTVFYNKKGARLDYDATSIDYFQPTQNAVLTQVINPDETYTNTTLKEITEATNLSPDVANNYYRYTLESKILNVKDTKAVSGQYLISGGSTSTRIAPTNTKDYFQVIGAYNGASHDGSGDAKYTIGGYFDGRINRGRSTGYVVGTRSTASYATDQSSNAQLGALVFNSVLPTGAGRIERMTDLEMDNSFQNTSPLAVTNLKGIYVANRFLGTGNVSITDARGLHYVGLDTTDNNPNTNPNSVASVVNNYGLYLGNIKGGTTLNRAIHTEAGQIRFGDLKGTGTRPVYADADGVLKVGAVGATQLEGTAGIECNEANRGKMNFQKDVAIGTGTGDAFAVCLKGTDGDFYWRYLYGAAGIANQTGAFGTGLQ
ncbi:hypothetical protein PG630_03180 [Riemerella anatipestifer]|nr:hypothetical protein [Riemerella anatipestifer]